MRVIILPEVQEYLDGLIPILYEKEYFGFEESAIRYVDELVADIKTSLHRLPHKPASAHFSTYGENMDYAIFPKNKNTSWYVFFTSYEVGNEVIYLIRHIGNNHTVAQYL